MKMYDPKSSNRIPSPAKILWFEFLLNPSFLEKHLSQENPDPSACELIIQFLANSGVIQSHEGSNCTGASNQHGNSSQSANVEEIILDGGQSPKEGEESKKCQALKLLALKVASFIKWDLNILEKKLPLTMQQTLITELLKVTGNQVDGLKISASGAKELAPVSHFAHMLFYSWILRAVIDASYPTKGQKGLNVQIPGQVDPSAVPTSILESISRKLQDETEQATSALEEILENGREVQMPLMDCFGSVTEESTTPVQNWDQSLVLNKDDYVCQVSFDLGQFYFFQEKYDRASKHFLKASNLHQKLWNPVYCNLNPAKLRGFYDACAHLLGFQQTDSSTPLKESLQTSEKNGHPNTVDILKNDNLKQEIPLAIRDMVEMNLLRENAGKKLQMPVAFLNAVRRTLDGQVVLTDSSSLIKANGEKSFLMLCDFVKEVALKASPRQKAFLKNFLRMICLSCGPLKTPFKNIEAINILFGKEEADELLSQVSHAPRLSALKLDKTFTRNMASLPYSSYSCEICGIEATSLSEYQAHIKSSKHKMRLKNISEIPSTYPGSHMYNRRHQVKVCRLCNIELRGRKAYSEHLRSEYHQCAIQYKELKKKEYSHVPERLNGRSASTNKAGSPYYQCQYCDAVHRSQDILEYHILSEHPEGIDDGSG